MRDHVAGAEARRPTRAPPIRFGDLRLRRAQQRHRQDAAPGDAQHVGGPSAAPVPRGAGDHRRQSRADAGEKAEPADKLGFAFRQLGNQGLRARPGEGQRCAIQHLHQQQCPEPGDQRENRRQHHRRPDEEQGHPAGAEAVHQHADMDRQKHRKQRAPADQHADLTGAHAEGEGIERYQENIEFGVAHREQPGDVDRGRRAGWARGHFGWIDPLRLSQVGGALPAVRAKFPDNRISVVHRLILSARRGVGDPNRLPLRRRARYPPPTSAPLRRAVLPPL
jgi:hypothetical protein